MSLVAWSFVCHYFGSSYTYISNNIQSSSGDMYKTISAKKLLKFFDLLAGMVDQYLTNVFIKTLKSGVMQFYKLWLFSSFPINTE